LSCTWSVHINPNSGIDVESKEFKARLYNRFIKTGDIIVTKYGMSIAESIASTQRIDEIQFIRKHIQQ
jgi:hypothetical protein